MQLFCKLASLKKFTFSKTLRGCRHNNLLSTLDVTQCDPPPPPLKNPRYPPGFWKNNFNANLITAKQPAVWKQRRFSPQTLAVPWDFLLLKAI